MVEAEQAMTARGPVHPTAAAQVAHRPLAGPGPASPAGCCGTGSCAIGRPACHWRCSSLRRPATWITCGWPGPESASNVETGTYGAVNYGLLLAGAVIAMIPCVVVYVALQRYYVRGLVSGALKG